MDIRRSLSSEDHGVPQCSKDLVRRPRSKVERARSAIWDSGVACAVLGVLIYSLSNLCVKLTGGRVPFMEVSVIRSAYNILLTTMMSYASGKGPLWGQRENYLLLFLRGLSGGSGVTLVFLSILCLPLPDSTVIQNLKAPFTAVLAYMCLREPMGLRGWSGVALSFGGVAVLAQPTWLGFSAGAVGQLSLSSPRQVLGITAGIAGAFILGAANIVVRFIGNREPALVSTLWLNAVTLGLFIVPMAAGWPNAPRLPSLADNGLLFGVAVCSLFGNVLITRALQLMSAGPMAAIGFTGTLYGFVFGALIFHTPITLPGLAGAAAVLAGVLLVTLRAKKRHARLPVAALDAAAAHQDGVLLTPLGKQPWADAGSGEDEHERAPLVVVGHPSSSDGDPAVVPQAAAAGHEQQQDQQQEQQQQLPRGEAASTLSWTPMLHASTRSGSSSSGGGGGNNSGGSGGGADINSLRRSSLTASSLLHTASAVWDSTAAECTHGDADAPAADALECLVLSALDNPGLSPTHCHRGTALPTFARPEGCSYASSASSGVPLGPMVRHGSSQLSRFSSGTIGAGAAEATAQAPQREQHPLPCQQPTVLQAAGAPEPAEESPYVRAPASRSASGMEAAASPAAQRATLPTAVEGARRSSCEVDGGLPAASTGWPPQSAAAASGTPFGIGLGSANSAGTAGAAACSPPLIWAGRAVRGPATSGLGPSAATSGLGPSAAAAGGSPVGASSDVGGAEVAEAGLAMTASRSSGGDDVELPSEGEALLGDVVARLGRCGKLSADLP